MVKVYYSKEDSVPNTKGLTGTDPPGLKACPGGPIPSGLLGRPPRALSKPPLLPVVHSTPGGTGSETGAKNIASGKESEE